jgi:hypothetical protein
MIELYPPRLRTPSGRPSSSPEPTTGVEIVRQALQNFSRKCNISSAAQELGVATSVLEEFLSGRRALLPPPLMRKLVERMWHGHRTYNVEFDALESTNKTPPTSVGLRTPNFVPDERSLDMRAVAASPRTLLSDRPAPASPKLRPGWLD